ncbi:hypothetical protein T4C_6877 [Trichinella pseudospiralis]|uniref:Chromatin assembly factor 1 subunit A n=1 Tax=Trichinella pseudospiralis TaxID=6337 RepID=A0A0V1KEX0_TRIPS|nr:hypothetical protein T4C_6877 [Trichinella pseudospiralis]
MQSCLSYCLTFPIIMTDGAMSEEKCNMSVQSCSDENSDEVCEDEANSSALKNSTDDSDGNAKESDEWNSGDEEEERRKNEEEDKRHASAISELRKILLEEDVSMEDKSKIMDEIRVKEEKKAEENIQRQRLKEEKILQREKRKEEQRLKKEQLEIAKQKRIEEKERRMAEKEAQKLKREEERRIRMEQKKKLEEEKLAEKKKQEEARQRRLLEKQKQEEEKQKEKALREKERQQKQMEKDKLEEEKRKRLMEKEKLENEKARKQEMMQERFRRFFIPVKPPSAEDENKIKDENAVSVMPNSALASNSSFELNNFYASIYAQNIPIESLRCEMKRKQCQLDKQMKKDHQSNEDSTMSRVYKVKFLQLGFSASKNCPYIGIFNETSDIITGRTPLGRDWELFDYNQEESDISDACLSEVIGKFVQLTKELLIAELYFKQDDEESSDSFEIDDFFVPADYLSDSERDGDPTANSQCGTEQGRSKEKECSFKDAFGRRVFNKKVEMEIKGPFWDCSDANLPPELSFAKVSNLHIFEQDDQSFILLFQMIAVGPTPVCTSLDLAVGEKSTAIANRSKIISDNILPDLINLVHGSKAGLQKIVDAFIEKCSSMNVDEIPSKRQTEKKIREIAKRELLPGGTTPCWVVSDELVEKYNLPNVRDEKPNLKRSLSTSMMDSPGTLDRFLQAADGKRQKTIQPVNIL